MEVKEQKGIGEVFPPTGAQLEGERKPIENIQQFVGEVYQLFAGSLLAGAVGGYVGLSFVPALAKSTLLFFLIVAVEFGLLVLLQVFRKRRPINLLLLFGFSFTSGLTLSPMLALFLGRGWGGLIGEAFLLTGIAFFVLTWISMTTKRDFSFLGKILFVSLILVIVASLLNLFLQLPWLQIGIAVVSSILFSLFILYDTQQIIRGEVETPVEGAVMLYLDFVNLFISLLQLLGLVNEDN
jgi:modulator of FtsH protease